MRTDIGFATQKKSPSPCICQLFLLPLHRNPILMDFKGDANEKLPLRLVLR